jgi:PmbA protein
VEDILAQAKQVADEAEVFMVSSEETPVHFEANRLKHIQSKQSSYVALRIIIKGRVGFAISTELSDRQNLLDAATETAEFGMKAEFELPPKTLYPSIEVFDPAVESLAFEEMVKLGSELINIVVRHTPEILCDAEVHKGTISTRIINSRGGELSYRQTFFSLGIQGQLIRGTDMLFVGESQSSCHLLSNTQAVADVVLRQLDLAREQAPTPNKPLPVIFTPNGVASALILPLMTAFNGKVVLEGASPIGKIRGEQVFDKRLSLYDDPTVAYRPQSRPADDEGTPSQRTPLIEQGRIVSFIFDLQTAALANQKSTGNGGRASGGLPSPTPSAFIITPASTDFKEMVSDVKEGLVIEHLMGAEQGNILSGDFSGNVLLGYRIESGKIVGRVKDTMVSGNVYQLLRDITAIGSDAKWVGSSLYTPSIYCPQLSVASK